MIDVAELTHSPEMLDGRVKTLHPKIHGGLLAVRDNEEHERALKDFAIPPIDLVAVNLYPFETTVRTGGDFAACIENIDIGGPALIRAGAKNHATVTVVVEPADYSTVLAEMEANRGATTLGLRKALAAKAYARTAQYDAAIATWFAETLGRTGRRRSASLPARSRKACAMARTRINGRPSTAPPSGASASPRRCSCKARSSLTTISTTPTRPTSWWPSSIRRNAGVAIIKHANPCGVAIGASLKDAYVKALACDPISAYGGIVALNRTLDEDARARSPRSSPR